MAKSKEGKLNCGIGTKLVHVGIALPRPRSSVTLRAGYCNVSRSTVNRCSIHSWIIQRESTVNSREVNAFLLYECKTKFRRQEGELKARMVNKRIVLSERHIDQISRMGSELGFCGANRRPRSSERWPVDYGLSTVEGGYCTKRKKERKNLKVSRSTRQIPG